jgi:hypothetical protein
MALHPEGQGVVVLFIHSLFIYLSILFFVKLLNSFFSFGFSLCSFIYFLKQLKQQKMDTLDLFGSG